MKNKSRDFRQILGILSKYTRMACEQFCRVCEHKLSYYWRSLKAVSFVCLKIETQFLHNDVIISKTIIVIGMENEEGKEFHNDVPTRKNMVPNNFRWIFTKARVIYYEANDSGSKAKLAIISFS